MTRLVRVQDGKIIRDDPSELTTLEIQQGVHLLKVDDDAREGDLWEPPANLSQENKALAEKFKARPE